MTLRSNLVTILADEDELMGRITAARNTWVTKDERAAAYRKAEAEDIQSKIDSGFCFSCGTWCHGDCGHYSADPNTQYTRDIWTATRELNYGIND